MTAQDREHDKFPPAFTGEFMVPGATEQRIVDDHRARYEWACQFVSGRRVLDIACGQGYGTKMLSSAGALTCTGVDISEQNIDGARLALSADACAFYVGDIRSFGSDGSYEVVVCFETIEHIVEDVDALRNLARLLTTDGLLIISTPNRPITSPGSRTLADAPINPFHVREYLPSELRAKLREAGLESRPSMWGQRIQPLPLGRRGQRLVERGLHWSRRLDYRVSEVSTGSPRYFVLLATPARADVL